MDPVYRKEVGDVLRAHPYGSSMQEGGWGVLGAHPYGKEGNWALGSITLVYFILHGWRQSFLAKFYVTVRH